MTAFISYARVDKTAVDAITTLLDRHRVAYWFDSRDLPGAVPWRDELREAIRAASVVVVCQSFSWLGSKECLWELKTAQELHKKIVYVDVLDQPADDAATAIRAAVGGLSEADRNHTDLLLRTAAWVREGQPRSALIRGALLTRLASVGGRRPTPPDADEFVRQSQRAARLQRRLRIAGSTIIIVSVLLAALANEVDRRGQEQLSESAGVFSNLAESYYRAQQDPFDGLSVAADEVRGGITGAGAIDVLINALDVPVPDLSTELPGPDLLGFEDSTDGSPPTVLDVSGGSRQVDGTTADDSGAPSPTTPDPPPGLDASEYAVDPDGKFAAVAREDSSLVDVLDIESGQLHRRLQLVGPARSLSYSPDGRTLAVGAGDGVALFDVATGVRKVDLRGTAAPATNLSWDADGRGIWAITGASRVSHWPWHSGRRIVDDPSAWFVALSPPAPDGRLLGVTQSGDIFRVDPTTGAYDVAARTGVGRVAAAGFDVGLEVVVVATSDGLIVRHPLSGTPSQVDVGCGTTSVIATDDARAAFVACLRGPVIRVDLLSSAVAGTVEIPFGGAGVVAEGRDALIIGGVNGSVYQAPEDLSGLSLINDFTANPTTWRTATVAPDGQTLLLTGNGTGKIGHMVVGRRDGDSWNWYTIDLPTGTAQQSRAAAISPDGAVATIGMADGGIHYFTLQDGNPGPNHSEVAGAVTGLTFVDNGVIAVTRDGVIDQIAGCTACNTPPTLVAKADLRLATARSMGLTPL